MKTLKFVQCARGRDLLWLCGPAETGTERAEQYWEASCGMHNGSLAQDRPGDAGRGLTQPTAIYRQYNQGFCPAWRHAIQKRNCGVMAVVIMRRCGR